MDMNFYNGKKVLVTGHTGFKGAWLCKVLKLTGAKIMGYSLLPPTVPNLFEMADIGEGIQSVIGDIKNLDMLLTTVREFEPEIVFHLAAQPIVRESYLNPVHTYETNVMGTVNILEVIRQIDSVRSFVNITTDKVYKNNEWMWGYRENDELNGYDPYSNSKSCSDLITESYKKSFFSDRNIAISVVRAGNVIGGGDFAIDRIIPDCIRAAEKGEPITVRNPYSIRPYQHVLEPIMAYLLLAQKQYENPRLYAGAYNVGPNDSDCITTGELVDLFCQKWGSGQVWRNVSIDGPHEANFLKLDISKIKTVLNWKPRWNIEKAIELTVELAKEEHTGVTIESVMERQIRAYLEV